MNKIYNTGHLPEDMNKSIFIALPKKTGTTECGQHRTSMQPHEPNYKATTKNHHATNQEQDQARNGRRAMSIRGEERHDQQDMYICFIDYTKAFDTTKHEQLMKILHAIDVNGKDLRIIQKLYWEQTRR